MIEVPPAFAAQTVEREPVRGPGWIASLPATVASYVERWSLRLDGPVWHGFVSLAHPASRADGTPAVLKLGWTVDVEGEHEAVALRLWDGAGAVRLLEQDDADRALLLERLDETADLERQHDDDEATRVLGVLLRRLTVPAPGELRRLDVAAARWAVEIPAAAATAGSPLSRAMADRAAALCRELGPVAGTSLVNEDLHQQNVLAGRREPWLVIDPKPLAGDPELASTPPLWNRWDDHVASGDVARSVRRRLALLCEAAGLDHGLAARWSYVRTAENLCWPDHGEFDEMQLAIAHALEPLT